MSEREAVAEAEAETEAAPAPVDEADTTRAAARRGGLLGTALVFLACLYVFLLVLAALAVLVTRALFGWESLLVTSGSMVPAMHPGDVVIIEPAVPGEAFDAPTVITFEDPDRGLVTHRIVAAERAPDGEVRYTTKGDANRVAESGTVGHRDVRGSVRSVLRGLGLPVWWARTGQTSALAVWGALTLAAVWIAAGAFRRTTREATT